MERTTSSRREHIDLLARPPCAMTMYDGSWSSVVVDTSAQLGALSDLVSRGLISFEEFEALKAKLIGG